MEWGQTNICEFKDSQGDREILSQNKKEGRKERTEKQKIEEKATTELTCQAVMTHTFNSSTWMAEAGRSL